jgi:hypothetical protein
MGRDAMKKIWNTSVNELVEILHGALSSLLPWLEKANIYNNHEENYDAFDNICNSLYDNIICSVLIGEVRNTYALPRYGLQYRSYAEIDFINVIAESPNNKLAFVEFLDGKTYFQSIRVAVLDENFNVTNFVVLKYKGVKFSFYKFEGGQHKEIDKINLNL